MRRRMKKLESDYGKHKRMGSVSKSLDAGHDSSLKQKMIPDCCWYHSKAKYKSVV